MIKPVLPALFATLAAGAVIDIKVGDGGLIFSPDTATAAVGDELHFHFYPNTHAVAQGDFSKACQPASDAFFSGFMTTSSGVNSQMFVVKVNSTDPMFFYCPVGQHCEAGMVGVINPSSSQGLDAYKSAASAFTGTAGAPSSVTGGTVQPNSAAQSSSAGPTMTSAGASGTSTPSVTSKPSGSATTGAPAASTTASKAEGSRQGAAGMSVAAFCGLITAAVAAGFLA